MDLVNALYFILNVTSKENPLNFVKIPLTSLLKNGLYKLNLFMFLKVLNYTYILIPIIKEKKNFTLNLLNVCNLGLLYLY